MNSENDSVYIGSTTQTLDKRLINHRSKAKHNTSGKLYPAMRKHGADKFTIVLIKNFPCSSKSSLEKEEFRIIAKYKARGVPLHNTLVAVGVMPESTKQKMSGTTSPNFKRGGVGFHKNRNSWQFRYKENGKTFTKNFSVSKYTAAGAEKLANEYRNKTFPEKRPKGVRKTGSSRPRGGQKRKRV